MDFYEIQKVPACSVPYGTSEIIEMTLTNINTKVDLSMLFKKHLSLVVHYLLLIATYCLRPMYNVTLRLP